MTLQLLKDFVLEPAQHCITGALRHIYLFHRYPISEEMLLGLGAGVGFVYWHMQGTLPFIGGRANVGRPGEEGLEHTAGRRTGVKVAAQETTSARKAEAALVSQLQAGQPVMVYVDLGLLPYFQFPEEYHFGGHAVVVAGYEAATGRVLVADRDGVAHPVTLTTLELARGSKHKPFPPAHRWYRFDFAAAQPVSAAVIWPALREAVDHMLHPPISNLGVRGIATAAGRILDWPHSMTEPEVRAACLNTAIMIDARGGTGGGLFR
ncbi:MAG: BtrH N-terminal domain-containing protein, partial [Anaerolineae bacterium]|nr:BtrH N-terminal domain-containing protein [Anaerolineae bacterium]